MREHAEVGVEGGPTEVVGWGDVVAWAKPVDSDRPSQIEQGRVRPMGGYVPRDTHAVADRACVSVRIAPLRELVLNAVPSDEAIPALLAVVCAWC